MPKKSMTIVIAGALLFSGCSAGVESDGGGANGELTKELAQQIVSENFLTIHPPHVIGGVEWSRDILLEVTDIYTEGSEAIVEFTWKNEITATDDDIVGDIWLFNQYVRGQKQLEELKPGPRAGRVLLRKWDSGWRIEQK